MADSNERKSKGMKGEIKKIYPALLAFNKITMIVYPITLIISLKFSTEIRRLST
jgi:hypothetical protein